MKFRPCIDIHNGKVKQIVGGSLTDVQDQASENFVSEQDASFYAELYKKARGVETELASLLGEYKGNPVTYAGGVGSMKDIEDLRKYGKDRLDVTVGSALDLFGGNISFSELIKL